MPPDVPRGTRERLEKLRELVLAENARQNLISPASIGEIDSRHIADSMQLLDHIPRGLLVDIGSGGGFPGLVLACCRDDPVHLVEPRAKRSAFLERAVDALALEAATIWHCRVERVAGIKPSAITARAVASLDVLFTMAAGIASGATRWILPKGRMAESELDTARRSWQGDFELVRSATDPESWIVIAENVRRRR